MKRFFAAMGLAALATFALAGNAQATPMAGSQSFASLDTTADTGDIITADTYTMDMLTAGETGSFAAGGPPTFVFGVVSLTDSTNTFSFSDAGWGSFSATNIIKVASPAGTQALYAIGNYNPGTYYTGLGFDAGPILASFTMSFTQNGGAGSAISWSGTLDIPALPPPGVPEPSTVALLGTALAGLGVVRLRRKRTV